VNSRCDQHSIARGFVLFIFQNNFSLGRGIMLRPRFATLIQFRSVDPVRVNPLLRPIDESENKKFVKVAIKNADWLSIFLSCCALQTLRIQNPGFKSGISYNL
jgi:hypothetical protein